MQTIRGQEVEVTLKHPDGTETKIDASEVTYEQKPSDDQPNPFERTIRISAETMLRTTAEALLTFVQACGDLFERARYAPNQGKKKPRGRKAKGFCKRIWEQYVVLLRIEKMNRTKRVQEIKRRMSEAKADAQVNVEVLERYAVKLTTYEGMGEMNTFCEQDEGGPRTWPLDQAELVRQDYAERNPKGVYVLELIP